MNIQLYTINGITLALIESNDLVIQEVQDAVELLANCAYQGASRIIIHSENLHPAFFDLKTGLAGDILQKFSTYQSQLAIVGDFSNLTSKSLRDFIYESNKRGDILFVMSQAEAEARWSIH
mgnify:CR=1 FL=1